MRQTGKRMSHLTATLSQLRVPEREQKELVDVLFSRQKRHCREALKLDNKNYLIYCGGIDLDKDKLLRMLNDDLQKELEATLIYTRNSFIMEKCEPSRVTEAISVDEMRHMWWLADLIVKQGGKPSMNHSELDFGGDDTRGQLEKQISLEEGAIERYAQQIKDISDQEAIGILKHILSEEKGHRKEYKACLEHL